MAPDRALCDRGKAAVLETGWLGLAGWVSHDFIATQHVLAATQHMRYELPGNHGVAEAVL
jgi:hypothetical protein